MILTRPLRAIEQLTGLTLPSILSLDHEVTICARMYLYQYMRGKGVTDSGIRKMLRSDVAEDVRAFERYEIFKQLINKML